MNLYNAEKYANMCDIPYIQCYWKEPQWGDYIYVEEHGRVVLGFDWLRISSYCKEQRTVRFAILQEPTLSNMKIDTDEMPNVLQVKSGGYVVMKVRRPIWQPKMEQILDMFQDNGLKARDVLRRFSDEAYGYEYTKEFYTYYRQFEHIEQKLLAYFMKCVNRLWWMEGVQRWCTIEQCKKMYIKNGGEIDI